MATGMHSVVEIVRIRQGDSTVVITKDQALTLARAIEAHGAIYRSTHR